MADVKPLRTLRYEPSSVGSLEDVIAPPYDVIDEGLREQLASRSPYNVVHIDLPRAPEGDDPYRHAGERFRDWRRQGVLVQEEEPAFWVLEQRYVAPDGAERRRRGFFARVRVEEYGAGRIRPHERTHPGPREDRLRLTRATHANLSPVFSLFPDPQGGARFALEEAAGGEPWAVARDHEGTENRLWRTTRTGGLAQALTAAELLIADGHHRYETARVYADEVGGEGPHRSVLMLLCALSDPGLAIFPIHRLVTGLKSTGKPEALAAALRRDFEIEEVSRDELRPDPTAPLTQLGYMDSFFKRPFRLTLKDQAIADEALAGRPDAYRALDTAVLEALVLHRALGMSEEDISRLNGLTYSSDFDEAIRAIEEGSADAGFFLRPTAVDEVRAVAETGEAMPPKSTYFYPKVPTGLTFNLLE